jgi:BlaI family transcriptional regulator, penicillinase repressor
MARPSAANLTSREAEIMDRLWDLGPATAEQIREKLPGDPHDSSVRTMLRILEEKGFVSHQREGRSFVFQALVGREKVQQKTLGRVIRQFFSGSAQKLVLRLLEDEELSPADLQELMRQASSKPSRPKPRRSARGWALGADHWRVPFFGEATMMVTVRIIALSLLGAALGAALGAVFGTTVGGTAKDAAAGFSLVFGCLGAPIGAIAGAAAEIVAALNRKPPSDDRTI